MINFSLIRWICVIFLALLLINGCADPLENIVQAPLGDSSAKVDLGEDNSSDSSLPPAAQGKGSVLLAIEAGESLRNPLEHVVSALIEIQKSVKSDRDVFILIYDKCGYHISNKAVNFASLTFETELRSYLSQVRFQNSYPFVSSSFVEVIAKTLYTLSDKKLLKGNDVILVPLGYVSGYEPVNFRSNLGLFTEFQKSSGLKLKGLGVSLPSAYDNYSVIQQLITLLNGKMMDANLTNFNDLFIKNLLELFKN
jgi:hypothetical protein